MPLLDVQANVVNNVCQYKFYRKPCASPLFIPAESAMPMAVKKPAAAQEALRILKRTKRELHGELTNQLLSEYSHMLLVSGYDAQFRLEAIQAGVRGYRNQCERADAGISPLHRPRDWDKDNRWKKKKLVHSTWYRPADAVMFCPPTPGAELQKEIQKVVTEEASRLGMKVRVTETGGSKVKSQLCGALDLTKCIYPNCPACRSDTGGGSHTRSSCEYLGQCLICKEDDITALYHGETGDNGVTRLLQHEDDIKKFRLKNAFAKHLEEKHKDRRGDPTAFSFKVVKTYKKPHERQISEGLRIFSSEADILMNGKSEWMQPAVQRIQMTREVGS